MEETKGPVMRIIHLVITFLLVSPTYLWTTKLELVIETQRKLFLTKQDTGYFNYLKTDFVNLQRLESYITVTL